MAEDSHGWSPMSEEAVAVAQTKALLLVLGADADAARKAEGCELASGSVADWLSPERKLDAPPLSKSAGFKQKPMPKCWPAPPKSRGVAPPLPPNNTRPPPGKMAAPRLTRQRLRGFVKRYSEVTEFGFIVGDEINQHLGDKSQVFLHRSALEDSENAPVALLGAEVSFAVKMSREGKPQARDIKVEVPGPKRSGDEKDRRLCPEVDMAGYSLDKVFVGTIKSFNEDTGFGFLACTELHTLFTRDVFLHHSQRSGFSVGDLVAFQIDVDPVRGSPKARNLKAAPALENNIVAKACGNSSLEALAMTSPQETATFENIEITSSSSTGTPPSNAVSSDSSELPVCPSSQNEPLGENSDEPQKGVLLEVPTLSRATVCAVEQAAVGPATEATTDSGLLDGETRGQEASKEGDEDTGTVDDFLSAQSSAPWEHYESDEGQGPWWWSPIDGDWFAEACPDPWSKYFDPDTGKCFWYKDEHHWFWAHSGSAVA